MARRNFVKTIGAGAVALSASKPQLLRVALIDALGTENGPVSLIRVALVEVVGLCVVDSQAAAASCHARLNDLHPKLNGPTQRVKSAFRPIKSGHSTTLRLKTP